MMHVHATHYEDFKRFVTGTGITPPKPVPGAAPDPAAPPAPVPGPSGPAPAPKAGPKIAGTVYDWGGTPKNGNWGCCMVSTDGKTTVHSSSLDGLEPKSFDVDFPDAIKLDGPLSFS